MEGELFNFTKVWLLVVVSLSYCYAIGKITPQGTTRLFCVLPILCLFLILPLSLTSVHLGGTTAFFIAWLANFKLLLFAFGKGPLSTDPAISLTHFVTVACLPIKVQQTPPEKQHQYGQHKAKQHLDGQDKQNPVPEKSTKSVLNYATKALMLAMLLRVYDYSEHIHPKIILVLYYSHMYFYLEITLAMVAALARAMLRIELEPQFDKPFLSSSLQDFWGRRWNLMVSGILRPTVYEPVLNTCAPIIGRRCGQLLGMFGTFVVSAVMHELIFYYLGRVKPTWEVTWFFLLHGACLVVEVALQKVVVKGRWRLPRLISTPLTVGFISVTGFWLFFPQLLRCKVLDRALDEYATIGAFLKNVGLAFFV